MAALLEATPDYVDGVIIVEFIYLILLASMGTQILFAFGMKYVSSNKAGIIFLLESVSAMILGWVFLDEEILFTQILGGVLIIASILISYQDRPSQKTATNI
jgi:drug/metabolite transporter (DMT)-like permease